MGRFRAKSRTLVRVPGIPATCLGASLVAHISFLLLSPCLLEVLSRGSTVGKEGKESYQEGCAGVMWGQSRGLSSLLRPCRRRDSYKAGRGDSGRLWSWKGSSFGRRGKRPGCGEVQLLEGQSLDSRGRVVRACRSSCGPWSLWPSSSGRRDAAICGFTTALAVHLHF